MIEVGDGGELGDILVDGEGMTLYIFDNDTEGVSNCMDACLNAWPPLLAEGGAEVEAGEGVTAELGTITRGDGSTQVTVNGFPAYYFASDAAPGDTNGQAVNDVWWVFGPDGAAKRPATIDMYEDEEYGSILTDGAGMVIYIFDNDTEGVSNCTGGCLNAWPPVITTGEPVAGEGVTAEIGTITRADGAMQVTINGFPAYYFASDAAAGDTNGQAVNNVWWVFKTDGEPIRPAKVSVAENATLGTILVDGAGRTLYLFDNDTEGVSNCTGNCLNAWPPLLSEGEPVALEGVNAELGTITRGDGTVQVTVNGLPVYYFASDANPGDANGQAANSVWWVMDADGEAVRD